MWVSINNTISQISNLVDVDVSPLSNWDALIYVSATWDWTATALPWGWDMLKATYDTDLDGVVDTAHDVSATPLITRSSVASQWGLLINIDSATGDIARTTSGFIENEKHWIWYEANVATSSAEFDTAVVMTWAKCLKLSATNATWRAFATLGLWQWTWASATVPNLSKFWIPTKPSTKYKFVCRVKWTNHISNSSYLAIEEFNAAGTRLASNETTRLPAWDSDVYITKEFTSNAATAYRAIAFVWNITAWNLCDTYYDLNSMICDEVVEPVANSLTSSSPSLVSFTAVGSTDNIDQSQLSTTNSLSFSTAAQYQAQQLITTKSKYTGTTLYKKASVGSPTGTMTFSIVNDDAAAPWTTVYATSTMSNATYIALADNAEFTVNLPCNIPAWTYWLKISYSVSSATDYPVIWALSWAGSYAWLYKYGTDWVTYGATFAWDAYFKTLYYKPTTNFKASQNNQTVSISADEEGFLNWSIINLSTGIASFTETFGTYYILDYTISGSDLIAEINLPWDSISASFTSDKSLTYSSDWATYGTTFPVGYKKIWVKILAYSGVTSFSYSIKFDNSLVTLRNYPTNKDVVIAYNMSLATATTTATYRATLYGFPAIEYATGVYKYLNIDTTATWSTVAFSSDGSSYTTVADWASIALSSTVNPLVWVKHNITANRLYLSSNDYNASSDKDGSNKMTVVYDVTSQGLTYTVDELLSEVNELKAAVYALQNP